MRLIFSITIIILFTFNITAREIGETEITTEDGIEVFQNEKFYLLKKNVKIESDNFTLSADDVKIDFDKSLYDITNLYAKGEVDFFSEEFGISSNGDILNFRVKTNNGNIYQSMANTLRVTFSGMFLPSIYSAEGTHNSSG